MSDSRPPATGTGTGQQSRPTPSPAKRGVGGGSTPRAKTRKKGMTANERSHILEMKATGAGGAAGGAANSNNNNDTTIAIKPSSTGLADGDMTELVPEDGGGAGVMGVTKSSRAHTSYNYINSILGSGVIGMPYALHQSGVTLGLVLLVFIAGMTDYSLRLMIRSGELAGSFSYQGMMQVAYGRPGYYLLTALQLIYPCIAMVSYNVIVGDTITKVLGASSAWAGVGPGEGSTQLERETVIIASTLLVTLPLSLYKNVARMSRVSFLSLVAIGFIMIAIFVRLVSLNTNTSASAHDPSSSANLFFAPTFLQSISIYAFAFMCHHNTFMIYSAMRQKSAPEWGKVTHISIATALAVCIVFALAGYATFGGRVQGDLLENYCHDDTLINVARASFAVTIMLTYPLECFVAREVIERHFWGTERADSKVRHILITSAIVSIACILSMTTDCLGVTLELNGLLAAIPLAYILPGACYLKLESGTRLFAKDKLPAWGMVVFGSLVSVSGLILLIARRAGGGLSTGNCSHDAGSMPWCNGAYGDGTAVINYTMEAITQPALPSLAPTIITN